MRRRIDIKVFVRVVILKIDYRHVVVLRQLPQPIVIDRLAQWSGDAQRRPVGAVDRTAEQQRLRACLGLCLQKDFQIKPFSRLLHPCDVF